MYSKFLKAAVAATLVAAPLATMADSAPGEQKGDWIVRAGFSQVNPESENLQPFGPVPGTGIPESTLVVDSDISFTFDVTYMFTNQFGVELLAAYPFTHGVDLKPFAGGDDIRIGSVDHLPPTLSLVWRPFGYKADVQPYIGVGVNYTMFSGEELRPSVLQAVGLPNRTELSLDDSVGAAGVIGVDLFPGEEKKWFMNAQVRYIQIESDAEILVPTNVNGVRAKVDAGTIDINPMVYGLHIGRRFGAPAPVAAPEPAPAPVVAPPPPPPPAKCVDSDNDGVCDEVDKCPNTPAGAKVDKAGCPLEQTLKVLFDFDSAELRPESLTELERVVTFMNDVPFATALVEGHTDSVGTEEYNQALSDRRAKAVFDYLSSRGIDPARLKSIGHGELKPIADNATAEGRQMNRLVMLIRTDSGM
jgi:outer membrane protein W/outer membrane protein OmpA-like peptidoglycan-associated protein